MFLQLALRMRVAAVASRERNEPWAAPSSLLGSLELLIFPKSSRLLHLLANLLLRQEKAESNAESAPVVATCSTAAATTGATAAAGARNTVSTLTRGTAVTPPTTATARE